MAKQTQPQPEESTALAQYVGEEQAELMKWSEAEALQQGWATEVFAKLEEGDSIKGLFIGRGADIELREPDPQTGETVFIPSWKIQGIDKTNKEIGLIMVVPGKYALNRFFRGLTPGNNLVAIRCLGKRQIGTRQVTQFATLCRADPAREATGPSEAQLEEAARAEAKAQAKPAAVA